VTARDLDRIGPDGAPETTEQGHHAPAGRLRLDQQLCFALYTATNAVTRTYRPLLRSIGLTYPQYLLMMALWEHDHATPTELAARLDLPLHGISPIVGRLQQQGLLERHRDTTDRRTTRINLTQPGRTLESDAARVQREVVRRTQLTPAALDQIRTDLHDLAENLTSIT